MTSNTAHKVSKCNERQRWSMILLYEAFGLQLGQSFSMSCTRKECELPPPVRAIWMCCTNALISRKEYATLASVVMKIWYTTDITVDVRREKRHKDTDTHTYTKNFRKHLWTAHLNSV